MPKKPIVRAILDDDQLKRLAEHVAERLPRAMMVRLRAVIREAEMKANRPNWVDVGIHPERAYTTEQLEKIVGLTRVTLYKWRREGLRCVMKSSRIYYLGSDIITFLFKPEPEAE